ncbi:Uncharacterised protein [uncultured Bacteroides sp.]|nr:Uncharacterised protein [uncultured Bacteroides sp.]
MIDHNHFICHFIFGGHLLNIPNLDRLIFVNFQDTSRGGIENNPGIDFFLK